jgi:hypothetical protein
LLSPLTRLWRAAKITARPHAKSRLNSSGRAWFI